MRRYETYKDSGVQWMGEIPSHWDTHRFGTHFNLKLFKDHKEDDELLSVFLDRGVIYAKESDKRTHNPSEDLSKYQLVEPTDFVMNNQQAWRGSVGVSLLRGIISPAYHIFKMPSLYDACYANYLMRDAFMVSQFEMSSRGVGSIQRTLNFNWLNNSRIIVPPLPEQQHIVAFLDEKIAKIDEYIAKKEAEIESLKEWKKAFIAHVVTKGLNPQAKMKGSGVSWIGEVPEHWKKVRFGSIFKLKSFKNHTDDDEMLSVFLDRGVIFASDSEKRTHNPSEDLSKYQLVEPSDFVMNNQQAWRGSVGVSSFRGIISPAYHIFTMPKSLLPRFANYLLRDRGMVGQFETSSRGVGSIQRTLNFNWLNNSTVCIPPLDEQKEIVDYIDAATTKADKMIVELSYHVENMKEYKQRLISDVVTGKINVQPA